eukprot:CAMPEP_0185732174 /NCGR_PEP_ID=MMETSP1171-20130828/15251_1 /TAXON_ID=374046 /ORGANISM="Helicotheca tamensis, Strain CCMP826" /LENGTH=179 /DNA_ID=CAMNT_0028401595 /DNA_START=90 /DNA_END=629 /DNA_ORIENTATION=+
MTPNFSSQGSFQSSSEELCETCAQDQFLCQKNRTVRFSNTTTEVFVELHDNDRSQLWYQKSDLMKMKNEVKRIVRTIENARLTGNSKSTPNSDIHCVRGIQMKQEQRIRRSKKAVVIKAVLNEQTCQREIGISDPNMLACMSSSHSRSAVKYAAEVGRADAALVISLGKQGTIGSTELQ